MATMYHVRVLAVEGDRLVCHVTALYPDEPLVPSRTLAFRFVWEPWYDLAEGVTQHLPGGGQGVTSEEARGTCAAPRSRRNSRARTWTTWTGGARTRTASSAV